MMKEGDGLASTWPKATTAVARRKSSKLFHRTTGSSGLIDAECGGGAGDENVPDEDSPSPPRVRRRSSKHGVGVSTARRNSALCLALCVSATSLVWIITRNTNGGPGAGFDTLGPWSVGLKTPGRNRPSTTVRAGSNWVPTDPEQVTDSIGAGPEEAFRRAAAARQRRGKQQMARLQNPRASYLEKLVHVQPQQQQQQQQQQQDEGPEDVAGVARDGADIALAAAPGDVDLRWQPLGAPSRPEEATTAGGGGGGTGGDVGDIDFGGGGGGGGG
ncbi:unnamed protein product, partial [Ectocarpus fasciculatus]